MRVLHWGLIMQSLNFEITPGTEIGSMLNRVAYLLKQIGLNQKQSQEVVTLFSELAYNLLKFTSLGMLTLEVHPEEIVIEASDTGAGVREGLVKAFVEGVSSTGTLGLGLPSIARMADQLEMSSGHSGVKVRATKRIQL